MDWKQLVLLASKEVLSVVVLYASDYPTVANFVTFEHLLMNPPLRLLLTIARPHYRYHDHYADTGSYWRDRHYIFS